MSGTTFISFSLLTLSYSPNLFYSRFPHSTKLLHPFHSNHKTRGTRNPRVSSCHGKLNNGPLEEIEEAFYNMDEDIEEDSEDEEETESSLDLLYRFLQSLFKKVSKRAKKATRSVLPPVISPQLVSFAVDGVLLLSSLSIVKALLEVVCAVGGSVFVVILLLRLVWTTMSHFQPTGIGSNQDGTSYGTT